MLEIMHEKPEFQYANELTVRELSPPIFAKMHSSAEAKCFGG